MSTAVILDYARQGGRRISGYFLHCPREEIVHMKGLDRGRIRELIEHYSRDGEKAVLADRTGELDEF